VKLVIRLLTVIRDAWAEMLAGGGSRVVDQRAELQLQAA